LFIQSIENQYIKKLANKKANINIPMYGIENKNALNKMTPNGIDMM